MYKLAIVVPIFNHAEQFKKFLPELLKLETPIILVDDGSREAEDIKNIARDFSLNYLRLEKNSGKGAAFFAGLKRAAELGFTHAFQIDADGQHGLEAFNKFLEASRENPKALINSVPQYDSSVPPSRYYGRKFTNMWVLIETFNPNIKDAMCGFRIYPIAEILPLQRHFKFMRMGFDTEIIVRASWSGLDIISLEVATTYPKDGKSNFRPIRDNFFISLLHTYLCTIAILRLPLKIFKLWR